jgi:uncharacterized protein (DUF952 family)
VERARIHEGVEVTRIYHITSAAEARNAEQSGEYIPQDFAAEGFIHCSYERQVPVVVANRFEGRRDLVLFEIDPARLPCKVVDENLEGGSELFPHIYGRLPMSAVVRISPIR